MVVLRKVSLYYFSISPPETRTTFAITKALLSGIIYNIVIIKVIIMQTKLIPIGNSFGIRLPKSIIKQFNFDKNNLEIVVKEDGILITPVAALADGIE